MLVVQDMILTALLVDSGGDLTTIEFRKVFIWGDCDYNMEIF